MGWADGEPWHGSKQDRTDGYIHLSTAGQLPGTLAKHYPGRRDLLLLWLPATELDRGLRWEPSRGGELFPHLYGVLWKTWITRLDPLELDGETHRLPDLPVEV